MVSNLPSSLRRLSLGLILLAAAPLMAQPVPTALIADARIAANLQLEGVIEAIRQSTVAAQSAGNVLSLAVKAGDRVRAGQLLVRIDPQVAQAAWTSADAGLTQAEAQLALARSQAERTRELRRTGFISQAALDSAEAQLRAAEAGRAQAGAGRSQAALARGFTMVSAPFDGVVLATHVEAGELAQPGRPLVSLYAPGALRAVVQLPSSLTSAGRDAEAAEVRLPDGTWVTGSKRQELPAADAVSQTVEWRIDLPASATLVLGPGQAVQVRFSGVRPGVQPATTAAPMVPAAAILRRGELTAVYVATGDRFALRAVRLGRALGDQGFELLAGLRPGERVALDPVRAGLSGAVPAQP